MMCRRCFFLVAAAFLLHGFGAPRRCSAAPAAAPPSGSCSAAATCGKINITYPFHLRSDGFCGYPALGLDCVDGNMTVLRLSTNNNTVLTINYPTRTMFVVDSGIHRAGSECPTVAHNVTVAPGSGVQFTTADASLTFLVGCAGGGDALLPSPQCLNGSAPIGCDLSGVAGERSYVFRGATATAGALPGGSECARSCRGGTVTMPVYAALFDVPSLSNLSTSYGRVLKNGFEVSWDTSFDARCGLCESSGGWCSYNRTSVASGGGALAFGCVCPDGRTRPSDCGSKRALVYDYMPNGSLERFIFSNHSDDIKSLSWGKLFEIAVGIARGLEYLHRGCNTRIVHFDIKPHNILLDENFCPKISDFGLAKLSVQKESTISIGVARGTVGYIAPEVFSRQFGVVSSKSDVYSYGMMILEMVGSTRNTNDSNWESSSDEFYFPLWIYDNLDQYCLDASEMAKGAGELVRKMIVVGLWCVQVMPVGRPSMSQVVEMLESDMKDLQLPSKLMASHSES
ncbi:putative receptor-like protein kinase [Dichanthelium oligosanthes]|uniref:Putative receptor-like protein kinase n=1 Tax=Dichanthelium oligosanthes TaxID=888268 RepID=A0A1E5W8U1_9POAL|nr:putative receptor-like protein kinase [Dichanthelium oligosanthes]